MTDRFARYIDYINNTSLVPLPVAFFDDDHEPVGPMVRADMVKAGLILIEPEGIYLRSDLVRVPPVEIASAGDLDAVVPNHLDHSKRGFIPK